MDKQSLQNMRKDYYSEPLSAKDFSVDPLKQFSEWFEFAVEQQVPEPNAFTLSTVNAEATPSSRIVLLKEIQENGIVFFTNYESEKGRNIAQNRNVAANFFWQPLFRQVRIKGVCEKISAEESDLYFQLRPLESRIGAITSPQSKEIVSREWLMKQWKENQQKLGNEPKRPPNWGGYIILIKEMEFWQGQSNRLHDRLKYTKENNQWTIKRLAP